MFDAIRNWLEVRAAMKDERRLRSGQAMLNSLVVQDKLTHAAEMLHVGQRVYATATMDEVLERFPDEAAELPMTPFVLIGLGRLDDAERLTLRGIQRNPDSRDFARIYCEISDHRPDIAERLRRWGAFRRRYPAYGLGFRMEAAALLAAGQDDAAETLLAEGVSVVRDDLGLASDYARRAEARADWPQARRRWAVVLDTFDDPIGASRAANALAELGRIDQAEAELTEARRRFPLDAQIVDDLATLAERRGDIDAALLRWSELRRDLPHVSRGYTEAARLLRDRGDHAGADALITEGAGRSPREVNLQFTYAALAERQGDWAAAAERWKTNRARFPAHPMPAHAEPAALRRAGQLDAAEQVLRDAIEQFPTEAGLLRQFAEIAEARGDQALAAERWQAVVAADPAAPAAHLARAGALAASGDRSAAEAALEAAIARLLDEPSLYVAYAKLAAEDGRAETAAARRAAARQRLGPVPALVCAEAAELRDQGRPDAARALLTDALRAAPESFELLHDLARLAAQAGDWPCAETCWRSIMTHHAYIPWVPGELAQAITAQGRTAEADAVLAAACEAHPQDFGIAAAWARLPSAAKDWPEAQRRWARLREKFPAEGHPLWQQGIALRESGDTEAARALFLLGAEHYPADASFPHDLARMAEAERDFPAAERWWRILVGLTPQVWWAHIGLAEAIRAQDRAAEAEAVLLAAQQALPDEAALGLHHARLAVLRHDWAAAEPRFRDLAARFPHLADAPLGLAMALRALGRPDEATEILRQGLADHPDHAGFAQALGQQPEPREAASPQADFAAACAWAREASEAQDWPEARRRWASLRERFPAEGHPCWQEGIALREQGRRDEARALFLDGAALFPTDASFPHDLARLAEARGDHAEAEACWRRYVGLEPRVWWGWVGIASALRAQGQVAAAEAVLQQGSEACPETPACLEVLADWARQRRDWAEAERRAAVLADRFPDAWQGLWGQAVGLREQGRTDDAHALLLRGAERHPDITTYAHDLARLAEARADWAEAERWWRRFLALDQRPPWAHGALAHALFMQGEAAAGDAYLRDVLARHPDQLEFH